MSDAVRRHPNLVEVTVGWDCGVFTTLGLTKGVLQKADVQKAEMVENLKVIYSKATDGMSCEFECLPAFVVPCSVFALHYISACIQLPAMT